jgi:hypothetical protein
MEQPVPAKVGLRHCNECLTPGTPDKIKVCGGCRGAYYCSKECQAKAWKGGHKEECRNELFQVNQRMIRQMKKAVLKLSHDKDFQPHLLALFRRAGPDVIEIVYTGSRHLLKQATVELYIRTGVQAMATSDRRRLQFGVFKGTESKVDKELQPYLQMMKADKRADLENRFCMYIEIAPNSSARLGPHGEAKPVRDALHHSAPCLFVKSDVERMGDVVHGLGIYLMRKEPTD